MSDNDILLKKADNNMPDRQNGRQKSMPYCHNYIKQLTMTILVNNWIIRVNN
jgi:hypothetical protein